MRSQRPKLLELGDIPLVLTIKSLAVILAGKLRVIASPTWLHEMDGTGIGARTFGWNSVLASRPISYRYSGVTKWFSSTSA